MADDVDQITDRMWTLLQAAVEGDIDRAYTVFNEVVAHGEAWTYSLLCGLSQIVKLCVATAYGESLSAHMDLFPLVYDVESGQRVNAEEAGPAGAFAVRFITANCNDDRELTRTIWEAFLIAHPGDEEVQTDAFASVLAVAVAATRRYSVAKGGGSDD
jgi:hypothetical protein